MVFSLHVVCKKTSNYFLQTRETLSGQIVQVVAMKWIEHEINNITQVAGIAETFGQAGVFDHGGRSAEALDRDHLSGGDRWTRNRARWRSALDPHWRMDP